MSDNHLIPKENMGRPKGSKTKHTPTAFRRAFMDKNRTQLHRLVDAGDRETVLTLTKMFYKNLPAPPVKLCKVKNSSDAVKALSQLIDYTAQGMIDGDQADRLERQITKYLEVTEIATIKAEFEELKKDLGREQI